MLGRETPFPVDRVPMPFIFDRFRTLRPGCPVLVCSGYLGTPQLQALVQDGGLPFLPKPFTLKQLVGAVKETMRG